MFTWSPRDILVTQVLRFAVGGGFMGSTLFCGASEEDLASVARKWYRHFVRERRKFLIMSGQYSEDNQ